jgi:hypothetical protein
MKRKSVWIVVLSLALLGGVMSATGQTATQPATVTNSAAAKTDCVGAGCNDQPPQITIATQARAQAAWPLQDRIAWSANLLLVLLGYAGILLALSMLKKIERQSRSAETAATAAAEAAQAALAQSQAMLNAERPWVLISTEPSRTVENGFTVVAINRGRSPARIVALVDDARIAVDELRLPPEPEFSRDQPANPKEPIILLPGESVGIRTFSREDVKRICSEDGSLQRVDTWEDKIFIYGKVVYRDLRAASDKQEHESRWCCWYIHGRQRSGLVMAGPASYNRHS